MSGRPSWRSLEELAGEPAAEAFRSGEFPPGFDEAPAGIDRRALVQLLGTTLSLAGLAACRRPVEKIVPFVNPPEGLLPGVAKRYATTMPFGIGGYGLVVESHEGRPTKIEGNELHPATLGGASAQMQAAILALYDPDRSRHPVESVAGAGAERRSWSDFVAAWKALDERLLATGGAGLAVLAPPASSPTLYRLAAAFAERFPSARWVSWEPVSEEHALAGAALVAGRPLRVSHDLGAARVIVALDADLLLGESEAVANARGFASGRRPESPGDPMNRLWVVESALTTTGAMADHRLAMPSGDVGAFALALAGALAARGVDVGLPPGAAGAPPAEPAGRWLAALAADLVEHRGAGVVVAGRDQPPALHALALAINAALGNVGRTVTLREPVDVLAPDTGALASLAGAMREGAVSTLVVLGGNPVYDAPADLGFAAALDRVETVIHLGARRDETGERAHWHLPEAHFLEAWGDARAADGTASVVQPLIEPLFGGRSAIELAGLLATGDETSGHDAVRTTWQGIAPPVAAGFDAAFDRVLHDGLLAGSASEPVELSVPMALEPGIVEALAPPARGEGGLELVFRPSPTVHDGRFANVGWLQELPDAIGKTTWGNAALLAPATAARWGVTNEQEVRLSWSDGDAVTLPVWIVPGQAEDTVVVHLGYGRRAAGRIGDGVGADVYPLRRSDRLAFASGVTLAATGSSRAVAQTQDHGALEGRDLVREATLEAWRREPAFARRAGEPAPPPATHGPQWGMTIDLAACTGCNACVVACQSENNIPVVGAAEVRRGREMHWLRIDRYFTGEPDAPEVSFQPVPCMHCEDAPCEPACPVGATVHSEDGLNSMVYNRCIGARSCSANCPYKVRRFNFLEYTGGTPEVVKLAANPGVTVRSRGVMEKCTYCVQRIETRKIDAKLAGRQLADGDVRTACQQTCPAQAIAFGDVADPASEVSRRKASGRAYELLAELGTRPRTSYLARLRNPHPELAG